MNLNSRDATNHPLPTASFTVGFINPRSDLIVGYSTFAGVVGTCFKSSAIDTAERQNVAGSFHRSHIKTPSFPELLAAAGLVELAESASIKRKNALHFDSSWAGRGEGQ